MDTAATVNIAAYRRIDINLILPSESKMQQQRRAHFTDENLAELAESIRAISMLEPILVRPIVQTGGDFPSNVTHEIVAGERRWRAAKIAGLDAIDCHVREMTDAQAIQAQLIENLQRKDFHPLEEATGYRELLDANADLTPEALGTRIGKSRAWVYARLKLLDLVPEARAALDEGDLDASKALVVTRFAPKLQAKIIKDYRSGSRPHVSYRAFVDNVREMFTTDLAAAPFSLEDGTLHETIKIKRGGAEPHPLPACIDCPHYSRNDPELREAFAADAHICTEKSCYDAKVLHFYDKKRLDAEAAGKTILTGDAARAAIPPRDYMGGTPGINAKWVRLDAPCIDDVYSNIEPEPQDVDDEAAYDAWSKKDEAFKPRTYRALLGALDPNLTQLVEDSQGRLVELYPVDVAAKILAKQHIELDVPKAERRAKQFAEESPAAREQREADAPAEMAKAEQKRQQELTLRRRVMQQIHAKWKGPLKRDDLAVVADFVQSCTSADYIEELYDKPFNTAKANEAELTRYIVCLIAGDELDYLGQTNPQLGRLAKALKIDPAKIRKDIIAEERAKAKRTDAPAAAKPAKKKSTKK